MSDAFLKALLFFSLIAFVLFVLGIKIVYDDNRREK